MSSSTRLLVLGAVRLLQPVHGYDVRRELMSWRADEWASVAPGSIYNALKSLAKDGLLEVVGTAQVGGRPERTSYRLTRNGEEAFQTLLHQTWWTVKPPIDPLMPALSFLGAVGRSEAIAALVHRQEVIGAEIRHHDQLARGFDPRETPEHVQQMMALISARMAAEIAWADAFIARLRDGAYCTADDPSWAPDGTPPADRVDAPRTRRRVRAASPRSGAARPPRPAAARGASSSRTPARAGASRRRGKPR